MSQPPLVLIPDRLSPPPDVEQEVLGDGVEVVVCSARNAAEISDDTWARADAVLAWHDLRFTPHVLSKLKRCRVLVRVGVGVDNVDLRAAGERGIIVCNVPDYATADVADHAMALMLALSRGLLAFSEQVRGAPAHWRWETAGALRRLAGSTLGIIGLGRIGTATALRAKAFDFRVAFYDPYVPDGFDRALGLTRCDELADLLAQADLLSIHTPLTPQTEGMAGVEFFARLRPGAIFVNTARGAIVNLDALTEALRSGRLRAAGLDVLPQEPPDPHHPLIRAWRDREPWVAHRLILTPHAAFYCHESYREMRAKAALEARRVLAGQEPRNCVNGPWLRRH